MKVINIFQNFINEEYSKNDPIPEITRQKDKLGIILLGLPGSGKSTFANRVILPNCKNIKTFSTDDISLKFTKDPNIYYHGATDLNIAYLKNYMTTGQNFIYDTTGSNDKAIFEISKVARKYKYKIIFIQIIIDLETAKKQNIKRGQSGGHLVDTDYIDFVYSMQPRTTKDYLKYIKPDGFYVVFNKEGKYKYFKFVNGELRRRKVDKYISFVRENSEFKDEVDEIVDTMLEFIEEGEQIRFRSYYGDMNYQDYLDKNAAYNNFKPVYSRGQITRSQFGITYFIKEKNNYPNILKVFEDMQSAIGRLNDMGWRLYNLKINQNPRSIKEDKLNIEWVHFDFSKPDKIEGDEIVLPTKKEVEDALDNYGLYLEDIDYKEYEIHIEFSSKFLHGELPNGVDEYFEKLCEMWCATEYEYTLGEYRVSFYFNTEFYK